MKYTLITLVLFCPLALTAPPAESVTLYGSFKWNSDPRKPGDLRAVFSPAKKGWRVAFHFRFDGRNHVYRGTAQGDLQNGELKGRVFNENRKRTFYFTGTALNGLFSGSHSEQKRSGGRKQTGTLELGPQT